MTEFKTMKCKHCASKFFTLTYFMADENLAVAERAGTQAVAPHLEHYVCANCGVIFISLEEIMNG